MQGSTSIEVGEKKLTDVTFNEEMKDNTEKCWVAWEVDKGGEGNLWLKSRVRKIVIVQEEREQERETIDKIPSATALPIYAS